MKQKVCQVFGGGRIIGSSLIILGMSMIAAGCTRKIYVPVEHAYTRIDTVSDVSHNIDSVLMLDSVREVYRGDTVIREINRWRYRTRIKTDTVYRVHHDTVCQTIHMAPENRDNSDRDAGRLPITSILTSIFRILIATIILVWSIRLLRRK